MKEIGERLIVAVGLIAGIVAPISCFWFARILWKNNDKLPSVCFCTLGIIVIGLITGLFLIALEKGI